MTSKRLKILIVILMVFSNSLLNAQDTNTQLWEKANAAYLAQNYQEALNDYLQILKTGNASAKLYFNIGNAYYKTGDYNHAILYLERAKLLAPNDDNIDFNIQFVNQHVVTKLEPLPQPFFVRWQNSLVNLYSSDQWAYFSVFTFVFFLVLAGVFIFSRVVVFRRISFITGIIVFLISAVTFAFAGKQQNKINERSGAIVFCPRVTVKSAPTSTSTDLFLIYEGLKVNVTDSIGTWKEIRLADGNEGWLQDSCIVKI